MARNARGKKTVRATAGADRLGVRRVRSKAAGSRSSLVNGAWNKPNQVGAAAMNGVIAATPGAPNRFVG